jgi:hypothetical protein
MNALPILLLGAVALLVLAIMGKVPWLAPGAVFAIWIALSLLLAAENQRRTPKRRR